MNKGNICQRCIMNDSDIDIVYNNKGICNHCIRYDRILGSRVNLTDKDNKLKSLIKKIKKTNRSNTYDCIIGVSGGVDSTYVAYLCKKNGLNPLAVHFDNGWNSELSVKNIEKCLDKLNIDLVTYVIDWDYFKEIQKAFLKSSTPDGEIPTDHAINALLFNEASKRNIKYVINGMNFATESMVVKNWSYGHSDWKYIKNILLKFSKIRNFNKYPHFSIFKLIWYLIKGIKVVSILNYIDYNKDYAMDKIKKELDWVYYGGKHYESIYTRFFQGYYLPLKFKIDKRRGHFSDLIRSKQLSRDEALKLIKKDPYPSESLKKEDFHYVLKKLEISIDDFNKLINNERKSYKNYPNNEFIIDFMKNMLNKFREKNLYSK